MFVSTLSLTRPNDKSCVDCIPNIPTLASAEQDFFTSFQVLKNNIDDSNVARRNERTDLC